MTEAMRCYRHPDRETRVSCATCGRPICTECMVQTEVGIKCPEDARLPRGARTGIMKKGQVTKSFLAGIAVAVLGALIVYYVLPQIGFGRLILSALAGYGAGTLIHRAGGRNGGPLAMAISGVAVAVAFTPALVQPILSGNLPVFLVLPALIAVGFAVYASR
jgi:B-box zinc finger protein